MGSSPKSSPGKYACTGGNICRKYSGESECKDKGDFFGCKWEYEYEGTCGPSDKKLCKESENKDDCNFWGDCRWTYKNNQSSPSESPTSSPKSSPSESPTSSPKSSPGK